MIKKLLKSSTNKIIEAILKLWASLDDLSRFMPSYDIVSKAIKWVAYFFGKIGESVQTAYYRKKYQIKESVELGLRFKDQYSRSKKKRERADKNRRDISLSNAQKRAIISFAKWKIRNGYKLTPKEKEITKGITFHGRTE